MRENADVHDGLALEEDENQSFDEKATDRPVPESLQQNSTAADAITIRGFWSLVPVFVCGMPTLGRKECILIIRSA